MRFFLTHSLKSVASRATAAFSQPLPAVRTRPGIFNNSNTNFLHSAKHRRNLYFVSPQSRVRNVVKASLFSRQFLFRHGRPSTVESEKEKPAQQPKHDLSKHDLTVVKRTGMNTPMVLSQEMQTFVGHDMMTRSQVISCLGKYIKERNLYGQGSRKNFIPDEILSRLLGIDGEYSVLALQKLISKHLKSPSKMGPEFEERSNRLFETYLRERGAVDSKMVTRQKDPRGLNSAKTQMELRAKGMGMYSDVIIDPCLRPICGGRDRMSRPQILKAVWDYIKSKNLQDPQNRRRIIVDDGLREGLQITDAATIDCFHIGRYLWKLCTKPKAK